MPDWFSAKEGFASAVCIVNPEISAMYRATIQLEADAREAARQERHRAAKARRDSLLAAHQAETELLLKIRLAYH